MHVFGVNFTQCLEQSADSLFRLFIPSKDLTYESMKTTQVITSFGRRREDFPRNSDLKLEDKVAAHVY